MSNFERERLTDAIVKRLPRPENGNRIAYDSDVAGFGCRVTAAGRRAFILNYRTRAARERRHTIGRYPDWQTTAARDEAKRLKRLIDEGGDPLGRQGGRARGPDRSRADRAVRRRARRAQTAIHQPRLPADARAAHPAALWRASEGRRRALRAYRRAAPQAHQGWLALHGKSVRRGALQDVLAGGALADARRQPLQGRREKLREQTQALLTADELTRLSAALAGYADQQIANIFRLLLSDGREARRGPGDRVGRARPRRWRLDQGGLDHQAEDRSRRAAERTGAAAADARCRTSTSVCIRRSRSHSTSSPAAASAATSSRSRRHGGAITKAAGITGLRIHDLRHSFASQLASGGASLPLIGALLGHSNPTTTHRYAHLFDDPQRAAVERVGAVIAAAGKGKGSRSGAGTSLSRTGAGADMAGKKGRSGRRKGSLSWSKNIVRLSPGTTFRRSLRCGWRAYQ